MKVTPEILTWHEAEYQRKLPCDHLKNNKTETHFFFHKAISGEHYVICLYCALPYCGEKARELFRLYGVPL